MNAATSLAAASLTLLCAATPAIAAAPQPLRLPPVTVAENYGFGAVQLSTVDADRFNAQWQQSVGDVSLGTDSATVRNRPIHTFVLFKGCTAAEDGNCYVTAEFSIYDPAGKLYGYHKGVSLWKGPKPVGRTYAMGYEKMTLRVENGEKLGVYAVRIKTTDEVAQVTVETDAEITVGEAK